MDEKALEKILNIFSKEVLPLTESATERKTTLNLFKEKVKR